MPETEVATVAAMLRSKSLRTCRDMTRKVPALQWIPSRANALFFSLSLALSRSRALSLSLSVSLAFSLYFSLSRSLSLSRSVCLSVCLSLSLSIYTYLHQSPRQRGSSSCESQESFTHGSGDRTANTDGEWNPHRQSNGAWRSHRECGREKERERERERERGGGRERERCKLHNVHTRIRYAAEEPSSLLPALLFTPPAPPSVPATPPTTWMACNVVSVLARQPCFC